MRKEDQMNMFYYFILCSLWLHIKTMTDSWYVYAYLAEMTDSHIAHVTDKRNNSYLAICVNK